MVWTVNLTKIIPPSKKKHILSMEMACKYKPHDQIWRGDATNELLGRKELEVANVPSHTLLRHHSNYQPPVDKRKKKISIQAKTDCFRDLQMLICIEGFMPHQLDVQSTVVLIRIYGNRLHSADNDQLVSLRAAIFECTGGRMKRPI
jgi:hypothetical protein